MRKLVIALVLMVGIMFVLTQLAEIEDILQTLERGDWRFLGLAVLVEMTWLVNVGTSFRSIYRILEIPEKLGRLILLACAANFINIVAPSAGIGGIAVFISEARQKEYSAGRVTVASTLFVLFDYIGFLFILTLGFLVLIPPLRRKFAQFILSRGLMMGTSSFTHQHWEQTSHPHQDHSGKTIEGDYQRRDD